MVPSHNLAKILKVSIDNLYLNIYILTGHNNNQAKIFYILNEPMDNLVNIFLYSKAPMITIG